MKIDDKLREIYPLLPRKLIAINAYNIKEN